MKRWIWELIGAAITLAVGAGIFCVGFSQLGWDFKKLDDRVYVQEKYEEDVTFSKMSINAILDDVNVSVGEKFEITYFVSDDGTDKYEIYVSEDGELRIEEEVDRKNWFNANLFQGLGKIGLDLEVTVTEEMFFELNINTVNSQTNLNALNLKNLSITSTNGAIAINDCKIQDGSVSVTNGEIALKNTVATSLNCNTINGEIKFETVSCPVIDATTVNGDIKGNVLGNLDEYNISVSTVNGSKNLSDKTVADSSKRLKASTVNGKIEIIFLT